MLSVIRFTVFVLINMVIHGKKKKKIGERYCTIREAINKDECENTGNSICNNVVLPDLADLSDSEKKIHIKIPRDSCNNLKI